MSGTEQEPAQATSFSISDVFQSQIFQEFNDSENWVSLAINLLAGLIILFITYKIIERVIDRAKEPARRNLYKRLVKESLAMAWQCERIIAYTDEDPSLTAPIIYDRFNVNIGWANISTIQFNEQLALFSGILDHNRVDDFSGMANTVARIRIGLNYLRKYVGGFEESLGFFGRHDPDYSELDESAKVVIDKKMMTFKDIEGKMLRVLISEEDLAEELVRDASTAIDRDSKWRENFAMVVHNILLDATHLCILITQYSEKRKSCFPSWPILNSLPFIGDRDLLGEIEAELKKDGLKVYKISDMFARIELKRNAILDNGLFMLKHVVSPTVVNPR